MKKNDERRIFKNKRTGEVIEWVPGKAGAPGWEGKNYWLRRNPDAKDDSDLYLDRNGNPVAKDSEDSRIEAPSKP